MNIVSFSETKSPFSDYGLLLKQSGLNLAENILRKYTEKQSASCTRTNAWQLSKVVHGTDYQCRCV